MKIKITSDNFEVNEDGTIIKKEDSLVIEADKINLMSNVDLNKKD